MNASFTLVLLSVVGASLAATPAHYGYKAALTSTALHAQPAYGGAALTSSYAAALPRPYLIAPEKSGRLVGVGGNCAGVADGYYPDADCTWFHQCSNGLDYLMPCPDGLWWSQKYLRCLYPSQSECNKYVVVAQPAQVVAPAYAAYAGGYGASYGYGAALPAAYAQTPAYAPGPVYGPAPAPANYATSVKTTSYAAGPAAGYAVAPAPAVGYAAGPAAGYATVESASYASAPAPGYAVSGGPAAGYAGGPAAGYAVGPAAGYAAGPAAGYATGPAAGYATVESASYGAAPAAATYGGAVPASYGAVNLGYGGVYNSGLAKH